jgi:hypothetical protein
MKENIFEFLKDHPSLQHLTHSERLDLARSIEQEYLVGVLSGIIRDVEEIIEIDSGLEEKKIPYTKFLKLNAKVPSLLRIPSQDGWSGKTEASLYRASLRIRTLRLKAS